MVEPGLIRLTGDQSRAQLLPAGSVEVQEGDEYALAFSLYIQTMVYGAPGDDNLFLQIESDASESPSLGLQLWDYPGDEAQGGGRGLWASGEAMGGDRFLAPVSEGAWHDVVFYFKASSQGDGFYAIYLDGQPIDVGVEASLIAPGSEGALVELGLFRDGDVVQGTSEIRIDGVQLGDTLESVFP